jgi:hypothetical protein
MSGYVKYVECVKKVKKALKNTAVAAAAVCCALFAASADAGYVVYQWNNDGNNGIPMGISQADAARLAKTFERIGECAAYEDACLAAFVAYYKPQDLPNIKSMSAKDRGALKKWSEAELKSYAAARSGKALYNTSYPQPYSAQGWSKTEKKYEHLSRYGRSIAQMGGGSMFPFGFNITDGEAVFENGRMNADKTKFKGRYEDILPIALFNGMLYDAAGLLSGNIGSQLNGNVNALEPMIDIFTNPNSGIYLRNAEGKEILTAQAKGPAARYKECRFRADLSPQDAIKEMNHPAEKIHWDEAWIRSTLKKLVSGVMASPVS